MNILNFLSDDSPWSTMRVAMFLTIGLFVPAFVYIWTKTSLEEGVLQVIPESVMWLLGTILTAKVAQKAVEIAGKVFGQGNSEPSSPTAP